MAGGDSVYTTDPSQGPKSAIDGSTNCVSAVSPVNIPDARLVRGWSLRSRVARLLMPANAPTSIWVMEFPVNCSVASWDSSEKPPLCSEIIPADARFNAVSLENPVNICVVMVPIVFGARATEAHWELMSKLAGVIAAKDEVALVTSQFNSWQKLVPPKS